MGKLIGIDLGTTKSCVAVMDGRQPQVIPNQEGARTTPSVVAFTRSGERLVGHAARQQAWMNPTNTISAFKRLVGRKFASPEVDEIRRFASYSVVEALNGDVHVKAGGRAYSTPEIASFVLEKLKAAAEDYLGEEVSEAIITVPAYFNDPMRQAIRDAALIAGLDVPLIISEPTAAALVYGFKYAAGQFIAVYHLGGGTFDISVLELADGLFQVRATAGDTFLGGEDFDHRIVDWLIAEFQRKTGIDVRPDRMALRRVKEAAEKAKCELSGAEQSVIELPFLSADASGAKHLETVLTRVDYESLTDDLLERTIEPCLRCLADASLRPDQIDAVLLVGAQTRAPRVTDVVRRVFGREPNRTVNPDEAIAMGAAVRAGIRAGEVKDLALLDVTPHTLGVETKDGTFTPIIERNSTIPTRKGRMFTTVLDGQSRVEIHVLQGESTEAARNKSLAKFELDDIPPAPRGRPQIEVSFEVDVNGMVSASAQDQATGRSRSMAVHPSGGLSRSELDLLAWATRKRQQEDPARREAASMRRRLDGLYSNNLRAIQGLEAKLTSDECQRIFAAAARAKQSRRQDDPEQMKPCVAEMEKMAILIAQAMMRP